jgi:hypothetical protein
VNHWDRWRLLLPALWAGALIAVAALATPAPFATLPQAEAGKVVARVLAHEARASLALGVLVLLLERHAARREAIAGRGSLFSTEMALALGTVFCTVLGYFALQPLMPAAKAGQGALSFAQLHLASVACYLLKTLLVLALAWRAAAATAVRPAVKPSSS